MTCSNKMDKATLKEFILLYKSEVCLWCRQSRNYTDKAKREAAYNRIVEQMKKIHPTTNCDTVIRKINSLRTTVRIEKRKEEAARQKGQIYKTGIWYYKLFDFLNDTEATNNSSSFQIEAEETTSPVASPNPIIPEQCKTSTTITTATTDVNSVVSKASTAAADEAVVSLPENRFDIFSQMIAVKLKCIKNGTQRLIAEKLINDALFMAEMGELCTTHTINDCNCSNTINELNQMTNNSYGKNNDGFYLSYN